MAVEKLYKPLRRKRHKLVDFLDQEWVLGEWADAEAAVSSVADSPEQIPCLYRSSGVMGALDEVLCEAEYEGECSAWGDMLYVERARITHVCARWTSTTARLFACDCAERTLPLYESRRRDDHRPRLAVGAGRRYARGGIGDKDLRAARRLAQAAVQEASVAFSYDGLDPIVSSAASACASCVERNPFRAAGAVASSAVWAVALAGPRGGQRDLLPGRPTRVKDPDVADTESAWQATVLLKYLDGVLG